MANVVKVTGLVGWGHCAENDRFGVCVQYGESDGLSGSGQCGEKKRGGWGLCGENDRFGGSGQWDENDKFGGWGQFDENDRFCGFSQCGEKKS